MIPTHFLQKLISLPELNERDMYKNKNQSKVGWIHLVWFTMSFLFVGLNTVWAQPFITRWNLNGNTFGNMSFNVETSGPVNYTWVSIPGGQSGSGVFNNPSAIITGLPLSGTIQLSIDTTNFRRIIMINTISNYRLLQVEQWGGVHWTSMEDAFSYCYNLTVSATDIPDLSLVHSMKGMFESCTTLTTINNINNWDVSHVTNMHRLFNGCWGFNEPLGSWDVSNVTDMSSMFSGSIFNQNIQNWDVSNVSNMSEMFAGTPFNQPIQLWNVSSVTDMSYMFIFSSFNQPLNTWDVSSVTNMTGMFKQAAFNQPIHLWDVSNVTNMSEMFCGSQFNQPIDNWNTVNVTDMSNMFENNIVFAQSLANFNTSNVVYMNSMFEGATYNLPVGNWNTSKVEQMDNMFSYSYYNQPLNNWDVSNVQSMSEMFSYSYYNQPLNNWDVSNVQSMSRMFLNSKFNQPLSNWNVSKVTNMTMMFCGAQFNQPISNWNVMKLVYANRMFDSSKFNQDIGQWKFKDAMEIDEMFRKSYMTCTNYSATLMGWVTNPDLPNNLSFSAENNYYHPIAYNAHLYLISVKNWFITGSFMSDSNCNKYPPKYEVIHEEACHRYYFDGRWIWHSGTYYATFLTALHGSDSTVELHLTIYGPTSSDLMLTVNADSFVINNQVIHCSGNFAIHFLPYPDVTCDSTVYLTLRLIKPLNNLITLNNKTLTANMNGKYLWFRCNPFNFLSGENNKQFTVTQSGEYGVIVDHGLCQDTSACIYVPVNGNKAYEYLAYPNPVFDEVTLSLNESLLNGEVSLMDMQGVPVFKKKELIGDTFTFNIAHLKKGIYTLKCQDADKIYHLKIVKE